MLLKVWLTITSFAFFCYAADYSDLEAMGVSCKGRDSCTNMSDPGDFYTSNCECDRNCGIYGDCCINAPTSTARLNSLMRCVPFGTQPYVGAYVVAACPRQGSPSESGCLDDDLSDPLVAAPVSRPGGPTYRNAHCAACNGADMSNLVTWTPLINCDSLAPHNVSGPFIWDQLQTDDEGDWGVPYAGEFHKCDVLFDKPHSVRKVRLCRAGVRSTCPKNYRRAVIRRMCGSYTAVVYTEDAAYRNPHCAICNGRNVAELVCDTKELLSRFNNKQFTFAHLFDVNLSDGDRVGLRCRTGETFDPYFKKCRKLLCGLPDYKLVGNKCQKM